MSLLQPPLDRLWGTHLSRPSAALTRDQYDAVTNALWIPTAAQVTGACLSSAQCHMLVIALSRTVEAVVTALPARTSLFKALVQLVATLLFYHSNARFVSFLRFETSKNGFLCDPRPLLLPHLDAFTMEFLRMQSRFAKELDRHQRFLWSLVDTVPLLFGTHTVCDVALLLTFVVEDPTVLASAECVALVQKLGSVRPDFVGSPELKPFVEAVVAACDDSGQGEHARESMYRAVLPFRAAWASVPSPSGMDESSGDTQGIQDVKTPDLFLMP